MDDFATGYLAGQDSGGGGNSGGYGGGFFGGDGIWAILLFAMIFGWGRGGFGGGGYGNDGGNCGCVTQADLCSGFNFNNLENSVRGIQQGICDSTYALNNSIMSGFHGVDNAVCSLGYNIQTGFNTLGYQNQAGFNALGAQLASCCCDIERGQDRIGTQIAECCCDLKTQMANNTRDIIDAQNCGTRAILDYLTNEKIDSLRAENQNLRFAASQAAQNSFITANQEAQTAELIRRLGRDVPVPAYVVPNPNCCYGGYGAGYNFGTNGCGCGCGCA